MPLARRIELLRWAEAAGAVILEDDYDSEYRYAGRPVEAVQGLDRRGRVIYVGTFSKVLFPSLRIGYLVAPKPLVETLRAAKWLADRHTPTLEQEVLASFIGEGHFERHLRRSRARCGRRRGALLEALREAFGDAMEVSGGDAGVHVMVWFNRVGPGKVGELIQRAAAAGLGLYPVTPYFAQAPERAGLLMGYASLSEPEIRAGVRILGRLLPRGALGG
jgi:GntR family transcriptional regulator/MocR family aminotransferase